MSPSRRHLEVVVRDAAGGRLVRCLVRHGRYLIGQHRRNEIVVNEPSVSGQHARLTVLDGTECFVEDLGSKNGVFIDGARVTRLTQVRIGSLIQIGATTLVLRRAGLPVAIF